ncbi:MAG: class I SAM-dependent methyltransferase [Bacteroidales bacterium]|nr:class I SAM-dependent methyltransferase [Bacteroidales bacterium]
MNSSKDLDAYVIEHSSELPDFLLEHIKNVNLRTTKPRMLSGYIQGLFLKMIVQMIKPKRILEIGTFTGFSALCFALGSDKDCIIDSIEIDEEMQDFIASNIDKAGYKNKINVIFGDALSIIPCLDNVYDLVFIDANKRNYIEYYDLVFDKVSSGGIILADNVLWDGHVLNPDKANDSQTQSIMAFNKMIALDARVEKLLLPLRDGLFLIRKK